MSIKLERDEPLDRILGEIKGAPRGILTDDQLSQQYPDINPRDRASVINTLVEQSKIEIQTVGDKIAYQFKKEVTIPSNVEPHEEAVYRSVLANVV